MCIKNPYPTRQAAEHVLRELVRAHPERAENGIHPCRAWHLTSHARGRWMLRPPQVRAR